jgi:hypothetical protein
MSPVRYEVDFYIPEGGVLPSQPQILQNMLFSLKVSFYN